jgi:hypothetical protein
MSTHYRWSASHAFHIRLAADARWTKPVLVMAGEGRPSTSYLDARHSLLMVSC